MIGCGTVTWHFLDDKEVRDWSIDEYAELLIGWIKKGKNHDRNFLNGSQTRGRRQHISSHN